MMIHRFRIYIDTSVIGGCLDEQFKEASTMLIERFKNGELRAVVSEITKLELKRAPGDVQNVLKEIPEENIEYVELTKEATALAREYISEGVMDENKIADAQHIAIAT
ncbi:MAG: PIN domain-containing protein, partial [Thermoplasmata archaeon]